MDDNSLIRNERVKGLATLTDGVAVAFLVAAGAEWHHVQGMDIDFAIAVIGAVMSGLVGWHLRGYLRAD